MKSINFDEIGNGDFGEKAAIEILAKAFNSSKRVIAMTGAGISVNAGIPVIKRNFYLFSNIIFRIFVLPVDCTKRFD